MAPDVPTRFPLHQSFSSPTSELIKKEERLAVEQRLKCVLLGDGAVGKTSLIVSYTTNGYPTEYIPTAFDNYSVRVEVDNQPIRLQICDTAGQDDFDHMRPLCYPGTDVVLLCFSVVHPTSLCNVRDKWFPEIKKHIGKVPIVLVGTQTDLRSNVDVLVDLARYSERPVTEEEAIAFARSFGALCYVECSALTQKNLKQVFDTAIVEALNFQENNDKKRRKSWRRKIRTASNRSSSESDCKAKKLRRKSFTWWKKAFCFA